MIARSVLLGLLPVVAAVALMQRRRLSAIIGMGLFSFMLAAVYALMHAPDVAITEATIGAALVTAIYILAIRRTGRLTVVADEAPGLLAREGSRIVGLEHDMLKGFAQEHGLDLSVQFVPLRRVRWLVAHREADIGAGGMISSQEDDSEMMATPSHLETCIYRYPQRLGPRPEGPFPDYGGYFSDLAQHAQQGTLPAMVSSLDLARALSLTRCGVSLEGLERCSEERGYAFLFSPDRDDLFHSFTRYLDRLRASGELDEMIKRYFP